MKRGCSLLLCLILYLPSVWGAEPTFQEQLSREFQQHNYRKVIKIYTDFANDHPDQSLPLATKVFYSQSLAATGQIDESIKVLKEVLATILPQMDPLRLQYDLANLLFMQKQYKEAKIAYQKVLLQAPHTQEILSKARQRIALMNDSESKKKDVTSLQLLGIETSLEASEVPEGADQLLQEIIQQRPNSPQAEHARRLLDKIREVRTAKAASLLDEGRRLFDEERKYEEVREILEEIRKDYSDVADMQSVELLVKAVDLREGKTRTP